MARVQIPFSFSYPNVGSYLEPVVGTSVTVYHRDPTTGNPSTVASVYQVEVGGSTWPSLLTDNGGNVPGWLDPGSYVVTAASQGTFTTTAIAFEAVRGDGVTLVASGAVDVPQLTTAVQQSLLPSGAMLDFAGPVAPSGFVLCNGSIYATGTLGSTYYNLSQAIGTNWNTGGEGGGNFRVPDFRGRASVGAGAGAGLTSRTLGPGTGEETHVITVNELAAHAHSDNGHAHSVYDPTHGHGAWDYGHSHQMETSYSQGTFNNGGQFTTHGMGGDQTGVAFASIGIDGAYTGISIYNGYASIQNNGSNYAHNNMQPFAVATKIIKL